MILSTQNQDKTIIHMDFNFPISKHETSMKYLDGLKHFQYFYKGTFQNPDDAINGKVLIITFVLKQMIHCL